MARPDHEYCTCEGLRRLTRRMTVVYDRHLAEVGLTVGQYSLLVNIGAETLPLSRLARRTATDRTTLTRSLAPLVKAGWVLEKTLPRHVRAHTDGAWLDLCLLSLSRDTWRARNRKVSEPDAGG